jgi:hypothetical protein
MSRRGFSKSRLERMHRVLSGYIERQELPGLVALVGTFLRERIFAPSA